MCAKQTRFPIHVTDRTEIAADDLKISILANIVLCHFKHAEMQVGDWAE